jgi:alpha-methylacyl-CoA racemase
LLEGSDACFAPVLDFAEAPRHPHNLARDTFTQVDGVTQPAPAPRFRDSPTGIAGPPPVCGEHADEVLATAGFSEAELADLRDKGVL